MKPKPTEPRQGCHQCGSEQLRLADGYSELMRVTSDCKPWQSGGTLALCEACGLVQSVVNERWKAECEQIYSDYTLYYQSGGVEQAVFTGGSANGEPRSAALLKSLQKHVGLPETGSWLDL